MSAPIKPPGGPPKPPPDEMGKVGDVSGPAGSSEAFRKHVETASPVDAPAPAAPGSEAIEVARRLATELRSGQIDATEAVERLIERAMGGGAAASLPPARRAELEAFLRRSLAEDPTLSALTEDLERGS